MDIRPYKVYNQGSHSWVTLDHIKFIIKVHKLGGMGFERRPAPGDEGPYAMQPLNPYGLNLSRE